MTTVETRDRRGLLVTDAGRFHRTATGPLALDAVAAPTSSLPLAYAYMRVPCNVDDDKVVKMGHQLRYGAERMGFHLEKIFSELICGQFDEFENLLSELTSSGSRCVIVPTLRHFAKSPLHQNLILDRLFFSAEAEVWELADTFRGESR